MDKERSARMRQLVAQIIERDADVLAALDAGPPAPGGTAGELLGEWYAWWLRSDDAPTKMPDALHVRTALFFATEQNINNGPLP